MADSAKVEALARRLMDNVANNNHNAVEKMLQSEAQDVVRAAVRLSLPIVSMFDSVLRGRHIAHKLLSYEVNSISAFHLAALLGQYDALVSMLDKDVAVDMRLKTDSTALHLACFGGSLDTVTMLIDAYHADINRQDKYGWSALHYASTEGHLSVVKTLVEKGAKIDLRDKDGTSAAWRAQLNQHPNVVRYLCEIGDEEELLNIAVADESLYSKVNKTKKPAATAIKQSGSQAGKQQDDHPLPGYEWVPAPGVVELPENPLPGYEWVSPPGVMQSPPPAAAAATPTKGLMRQRSDPARQRPVSDFVTGSRTLPTGSRTLPTGSGAHTLRAGSLSNEESRRTVRRVIRQELEAAFCDYEKPLDAVSAAGVGAEGGGAGQSDFAGVGMTTLNGIMREEMLKYVHQVHANGAAAAGAAEYGLALIDNDVYENPYESLSEFLLSSPEPPPLPPPRSAFDSVPSIRPPPPTTTTTTTTAFDSVPSVRPPPPPTTKSGSTGKKTREPPVVGQPRQKSPPQSNPARKPSPLGPKPRFVSGLVQLEHESGGSMALQQCVHRLARLIGDDWKRLARALPIERSTEKTNERVSAIEKQYAEPEERAAAVLGEWRINRGNDASVDAVILALRRCSLHGLIAEVEVVSSEYTA